LVPPNCDDNSILNYGIMNDDRCYQVIVNECKFYTVPCPHCFVDKIKKTRVDTPGFPEMVFAHTSASITEIYESGLELSHTKVVLLGDTVLKRVPVSSKTDPIINSKSLGFGWGRDTNGTIGKGDFFMASSLLNVKVPHIIFVLYVSGLS
jgi:hypothetical protein